jgi:hypothetical protein
MSIGVVLKLFVLALIVFAVAFGLRRTFLWDVMPVSSDQAPQSLWALGAAFLLRSLENIAAVVAGLAVIIAGAMRLIRWRAALNHTLRAIDPRGVAAGPRACASEAGREPCRPHRRFGRRRAEAK